MSRVYNAALPIAWVTLRILIILNWLYGAMIVGLLGASFANPAWFAKAIHVPATVDKGPIMAGLQAIAVLGLLSIPLNYVLLKRLLAIVETVRKGDPFVAANAYRLQTIAWMLLLLQLLSMAIGGIGKAIRSPEFPLHLDAGFSINGWLCVILAFVLARVFAEGALMREDLEGTI